MFIFNKHQKSVKSASLSGFSSVRDILDYLYEKKAKVRLYFNNLGDWEIKVGTQPRKKKENEEDIEEKKEDKEE